MRLCEIDYVAICILRQWNVNCAMYIATGVLAKVSPVIQSVGSVDSHEGMQDTST